MRLIAQAARDHIERTADSSWGKPLSSADAQRVKDAIMGWLRARDHYGEGSPYDAMVSRTEDRRFDSMWEHTTYTEAWWGSNSGLMSDLRSKDFIAFRHRYIDFQPQAHSFWWAFGPDSFGTPTPPGLPAETDGAASPIFKTLDEALRWLDAQG